MNRIKNLIRKKSHPCDSEPTMRVPQKILNIFLASIKALLRAWPTKALTKVRRRRSSARLGISPTPPAFSRRSAAGMHYAMGIFALDTISVLRSSRAFGKIRFSKFHATIPAQCHPAPPQRILVARLATQMGLHRFATPLSPGFPPPPS